MNRLLHVALLVAILFVAGASAQDADQLNKLRLAQEFENANLWERATSLYEELHRADPTNFVFFDGLQRGYRQLKEYDKAIALTQERLRMQPADPGLLSAIAGMQFDAGRETVADSLWEYVLTNSGKTLTVYQMVAMEMLERRLYDRAIRVYVNGRAVSRMEATFTNELGNLYAALQQYSQATEEYLRRLRAYPDQLLLIESQFAAFVGRPAALQQAIIAVKAEAGRSPGDVPVRRLLAWLYTEGREYDSAVREYEAIDELTNARGAELFAFAQRLHQEHADAPAAEAFRGIIQRGTNPALIPGARYGYAQALEALSADTGALSLPNPPSTRPIESQATSAGVLRLYEAIVADYPGTDLAAQALYRIGVLRHERFFDLTGALAAFEQVKLSPRGAALRLDAMMRTAAVQVARNDIARARKEYADVTRQSHQAYQEQAAFRLAELDYFEGRFDSSLAQLSRFKTAVTGDLANDALALQYFIQENAGGAPRALAEFASADLALRQRKHSEALAQFTRLVTAYPQALLVDDAHMRIGDIFLVLRRPDDALVAFRMVADSLPESIWKDRALFRIGEVLEQGGDDPTRATAAYETLLVRYPTSLFADEARRRIRALRGDQVP